MDAGPDEGAPTGCAAMNCDDADPCTVDSCDDVAGCQHQARDLDGDGYGDAACGGHDCNDSDPAVHPSATERCNGVDDNCNGTTDEGCTCAPGSTSACATICSSTGTQTCDATGSWGTCVPPAEVCNGVDDNCNGAVDEGCGPTNDTCAGATPIALLPGRTTVFGSTASATDGPGGCTAGGRDVWYSFTLAYSEIVFINTFGSSFDTNTGVTDFCGGTLTGCFDDACGTLQDGYWVALAAGTHYVVVDGVSGASGAFALNIEHLPMGGDGLGRVLTGGTTASFTGTTSGPSGVSATCGGATGPEHLYFWTQCPTAPGGTFRATTCNSTTNFDTVLYVASGPTGGTLACNDDDAGCPYGTSRSTIAASIPSGAGLFGVWVDAYTTGGTYLTTISVP